MSGAIDDYGSNLRVGDTIAVWWGTNADTIVRLQPYDGPLNHLFPAGAQVAKFALNQSGMAIDNGDLYPILGRISSPPSKAQVAT